MIAPRPWLTPNLSDSGWPRFVRRARFVLLRGVLGWGLIMAAGMLLWQWRSGDPGAGPGTATLLAYWSVIGVGKGVHELRRAERGAAQGARVPRCPDCGEATPSHRAWCPSIRLEQRTPA